MRALGIDPGSRLTGWGVVERTGTCFRELASGTIRLGTSTDLALYGTFVNVNGWSAEGVRFCAAAP